MSFDVQETILSQYSSSPRLRALVEGLAKVISPNDGLESLYKNLIDVDTASGICLDVWGRIVGVKRELDMTTEIGAPYFSFKSKANPTAKGFNQAPFYYGAHKTTFTVSDDAYRLYIKAKAMANISTGSLQELNAMIQRLLPECEIHLYRTAPMHLKLVVIGTITDYEKNILLSGTFPPIPTGVTLEVDLKRVKFFGFNDTDNTGFNRGPFKR